MKMEIRHEIKLKIKSKSIHAIFNLSNFSCIIFLLLKIQEKFKCIYKLIKIYINFLIVSSDRILNRLNRFFFNISRTVILKIQFELIIKQFMQAIFFY